MRQEQNLEEAATPCPNCGAELTDGAQFCEQCGAALEEPKGEIASVKTPNDNPYASTVTSAPSVKKFKSFLIQNLSIAVLGVLGTVSVYREKSPAHVLIQISAMFFVLGLVGAIFSVGALLANKSGNTEKAAKRANMARAEFHIALVIAIVNLIFWLFRS